MPYGENVIPQICKKCGTERGWSHTKTKCWGQHGLCLTCAKEDYPRDYNTVYEWLEIDCKCPGCGMVHKNPYQQHKLKETQDIGQLKAYIEELEKKVSPDKKEDALTQVETVIQSLREDKK